MAAELRSFYSEPYINLIAEELSALTSIDTKAFVAAVFGANWSDFTLKERSYRITETLVSFLPEDPIAAIEILKKLLPKVSGDAQKYADMLTMFVPDYILHKQDQLTLDQSLEAMKFFTSNGTSSELTIRQFLIEEPDYVMKKFNEWADNDHHHVRRWTSEGCRPRLPWAIALPAFKKDPAPIMPILEKLRADPSKFVQKSVANNLNDIAKDNPDVVLDFAEKWIGTHKNTDWILKHGLRTLLKKGDQRALALFGSKPVVLTNTILQLESTNVAYGTNLEFTFEGAIAGDLPDNLRIEYAIDFLKANGSHSRKVFKISETQPSNRKLGLSKSHKFIDYTTRKHYPGIQHVTLIVNGQEVETASFELVK